MKEAALILRRARERLADGALWAKLEGPAANGDRCPPGARCLGLAVLLQDAPHDTKRDALMRLWDLAGRPPSSATSPLGRISLWNDAPERTWEEVDALLRRAECLEEVS